MAKTDAPTTTPTEAGISIVGAGMTVEGDLAPHISFCHSFNALLLPGVGPSTP